MASSPGRWRRWPPSQGRHSRFGMPSCNRLRTVRDRSHSTLPEDMRVLIVSQFFPPEHVATQNRLGGIANGLAERGHEVTVECEQPNHPAGVFFPGFGRRLLEIES